MTHHTCATADAACYRCDLGTDEVEGYAADMRWEAVMIRDAIADLDSPAHWWVVSFLEDEIKERADSADAIDRLVADYRARQQKAREVSA